MSSPEGKEINFVRCLKCGKILKCSHYDTSALIQHVRTDHPEVDIIDTDTKLKKTELKKPSPKPRRNSFTKQEDKIEECPCSDEDCDLEECSPYSKGKVDDASRQPQYVKDLDLTHYSVTSELLEKYPEIKESEYSPHNPDAQIIYTKRYRVNTPSMSILQQPFQYSLYRSSIRKWCPANGKIYCPKCGCHKRPLIKTNSERFTYNEWCACCLFSCWPFCFLPWIMPGQNDEYLYCANCKTFLGLYNRSTNCLKPNRLYAANDNEEGGNEQPNRNQNHVKDTKLYEGKLPPQSSAGDSGKSKPSITINGKELPPETVARIQKYKRFGSLVGLDMDALTNPEEAANSKKLKGKHKENL